MERDKEKNYVQARVMNYLCYGLQKALYKIVGRSAFATTRIASELLYKKMKEDLGLDIGAEDSNEIFDKIGEILVKEFEIAEEFKISKKDNKVYTRIKGCVNYPIEAELAKEGIQPLICPYVNIVMAAIKEKHGLEVENIKILTDKETKICDIEIKLTKGR